MKAVMYHYVRQEEESIPFFIYLHLENFRRQLDYFTDRYDFISLEEFMGNIKEGTPVNSNGLILTFDDGFIDHYRYVYPELAERNLWAIFYIPTSIYNGTDLLDVHGIHLLLGAYGGASMMSALEEMITDDMLVDRNIDSFRKLTYHTQDNEEASRLFRQILNYYISYEHRHPIIVKLLNRFFGDKNISGRFYMTLEHLKEMKSAGMVIGSHGNNHLVYSKLTPADQEEDIKGSFDFFEKSIGPLDIKTFCYPYGIHSCTSDAIGILDRERCLFSFTVENRDVTQDDLKYKSQALPRHACHLLPYGRSHIGLHPPQD